MSSNARIAGAKCFIDGDPWSIVIPSTVYRGFVLSVPCLSRIASLNTDIHEYGGKESRLVITSSHFLRLQVNNMRTANSLSRAQVQMVLSKIPFFRAFSCDERERIADEQSSFHIARDGEFIIRKDSQEYAFYLLLSGSCDVLEEEQGAALMTLEPGAVFGEIGFLSEQPRTTHVIARQPSILMRVDRATLSRFKPEIREKFKDQLIDKLVKRIIQSQ